MQADRQVIHGEDAEAWGKQVTEYINTQIRNGKDVTVYTENGVPLTITEDTAGKAAYWNKNEYGEPTSKGEYGLKLRIETHIDEAAQVSKGSGTKKNDTKAHAFASGGWNYRTAYFEDFDGKYYSFQISTGKKGKVNTIYNINRIEEATLPKALIGARPQNATVGLVTSSEDSIAGDAENVKEKYSLKETDIADQVAQDPVLQSQLQSDRSIRALAEMMDKLHKTVLRGDSFLQEGATEPALKAGEWAKRTGAIADKLIQETGTTLSKQYITRMLRALYKGMDNINMDAGEAMMFARSAARQMLEKSPGVLAEQDDTTKAVVQAAKNNAFYLTDDMKSEIRGTYGSVQTYLRKNFGRMKIRSKSGTTISLSEFWRETLNPLSPGTFSLDVTEADMPGILDAFLENAGQKRYSEAYGANIDQYATDLALGIMLEYYDVPGGIGKAEGLRQAFIKDREELRQSYQQRLTSQAERRQENQQRQRLRGQIERDSRYTTSALPGTVRLR